MTFELVVGNCNCNCISNLYILGNDYIIARKCPTSCDISRLRLIMVGEEGVGGALVVGKGCKNVSVKV